MNRDSPSYYIEPSPESSIAATRDLINYVRTLSAPSSNQEPLVQPILTPRFAISCTDELLASLGTLASSDPTLRIQTHISENPSEVAYTRELFPAAPHYAGVYDMFGLLKHNTILAHAVHLTEDEVNLVKERNAGISHCPTSNFNLSSGIAPIGHYLDKGIKVRECPWSSKSLFILNLTL
jgi:guanine deaminase